MRASAPPGWAQQIPDGGLLLQLWDTCRSGAMVGIVHVHNKLTIDMDLDMLGRHGDDVRASSTETSSPGGGRSPGWVSNSVFGDF